MTSTRDYMVSFIAFLLFFTGVVHAADTHTDYYTRFHHITVEDGLPDNHITVIKEDDRGFIWIGTRKGLTRFDGVSYHTFLSTADSCSISDDYIMDIAIDKDNQLWIATHNGLNRYNRKTQCFEKIPLITEAGKGISHPYVRAILPDENGDLWVETLDGILQLVHPYLTATRLYPHDRIHQAYYDYHTIFKDKKGLIWVGGRGVGPMYLDRESESFTVIENDPTDPQKKRDKDVAFYFEDSKNQFWTGATDGAYIYDRKADRFTKMLATSTFDVIEDDHQNIWMATGSGLYRYSLQTGNFTKYGHFESDHYSLSDNHVNCVFKDSGGRIWAGTQNGISIWSESKNQMRHYRHLPHHAGSLSDEHASVFLEDRLGRLWIGTMGGGLNQFEEATEEFDAWTQQNSDLLSNRISALYQDQEGSIWIGHWVGRGFQKLDAAYQKLHSYALSPNTRKVDWYSAFTDYNDTLLMTGIWGASGLHLFDKKRETFLPYTWRKLHHPYDRAMTRIAHRNGVLWASTDNNIIYQFDLLTQSFEGYHSETTPDLNDNHGLINARLPIAFELRNIYVADDKSYFLTDKGIYLKSSANPEFTLLVDETFETMAHLPGDKGIWLGNERGLSYLDPRGKLTQILPASAPTLEGQPIMVISPVSTDRLLIGTSTALHCYHTKEKSWTDPEALQNHNRRNLTTLNIIPISETEFVVTHQQGFSFFDSQKETIRYYDFSNAFQLGLSSNIIYDAIHADEGVWLATNQGVFHFNPDQDQFSKLRALEDWTIYGIERVADSLYLATEHGLMSLDSHGQVVPFNEPPHDIITSHLTSFVHKDQEGRYIWSGTTIKGVNRMDIATREVSHYYTGHGYMDQAALSICETSDGTIWVGGQYLNRYNELADQFEVPDFARLFPDEDIVSITEASTNLLFVATQHHLYRINLTDQSVRDITNLFDEKSITFSSGAIQLKQGEIFVGSDKGCFRFDPAKLEVTDPQSPVKVTSVNIVDYDLLLNIRAEDRIVLEPDQNFFSIAFSGMNFAEKGTNYQYQLVGVDQNWVTTAATSVTYTKISHGSYTFRVKREEEPVTAAFTFDIRIKPPFWATWWFITGFILINATLIFYWWQLQLSRIRISEKNLDLKQRLLLSQMNPHFLFNILTTIQGFIYKKEPEVAGTYLSKFARLMRLYLNNMSFEQVSLEKEEDTLRFYLELQRVRHDNHFDFDIVVECDEIFDMIGLPSMMIQPFVENAVSHGVSELPGDGFVLVHIKLEENHWKVIVEDNGPGYNPLAQNNHHQSRSIQITLDRLAMLSKHYKDRFTLRITNLSETGEGKKGTRVEMILPVMELVKAIKHDTHSHSR